MEKCFGMRNREDEELAEMVSDKTKLCLAIEDYRRTGVDNIGLVESLLKEMGNSIDIIIDKEKNTLLHLAVDSCYASCVELLLSKGWNANALNIKNENALYKAARQMSKKKVLKTNAKEVLESIIIILLRYGARDDVKVFEPKLFTNISVRELGLKELAVEWNYTTPYSEIKRKASKEMIQSIETFFICSLLPASVIDREEEPVSVSSPSALVWRRRSKSFYRTRSISYEESSALGDFALNVTDLNIIEDVCKYLFINDVCEEKKV